ncbi:hypothetical protein DMB84_020545, partial [Pectobacterium aquaticum]
IHQQSGIPSCIAEGALEVGGKAVAKGCLGLHAPTKDKLDLVFYHEGITAKVYVNYTVNISQGTGTSSNEDGGVFGNSSSDSKVEKSNNAKKEWVIHDKLEKNKSECKFSII